jgi:hypothetical protein
MYFPFIPFRASYITKLLSLKRRYLVAQDHPRPSETEKRILLTDYDDIGLAEMHFKAVRTHRFAAILDLHRAAHLNKLNEILDSCEHQVWWTVVENKQAVKKAIDTRFKTNIRRYVQKHTDWKPGGKGLDSTIQVIFGQLYIVLTWGNQTIRVKFEEIESS